MTRDRARVHNLIEEGQRFLVCGHRRPDGDALGAALGLARGLRALGKHAEVFCPDDVPESLEFLTEGEPLVREAPTEARWDALFVTDTAAPELLPEGLPGPEARGPLVVVDHHVSHRPFGDYVIRDPRACATGEVVRELLRDIGLSKLPVEVATPLYTAVVADTGGFRYASTDARTLRLGAELVEAGAKPWLVAKNLYEGWPRARLDLLHALLGALRYELDGRLAMMSVPRSLLESTGAADDMIDGLVNYGRRARGVEIAALLWEQDPPSAQGRVRLSLRAGGDVDVAALATCFGGGGHRAAAGATIIGAIEDAERAVIARASSHLSGAG